MMSTASLCVLVSSLILGQAHVEMPRSLDDRVTVELFAAEPDIVTPTGLAVDAKGRVLAVESHTHFRPEGYKGPPADRIRCFEDTDGDGKADKITTFFEGTQWTMNVAIERDGAVLVATRASIFRLRDKDNDGRAEVNEPLLKLETSGTYPHNGLSGFAVDFDGTIYFGLGENLGADYKLTGSGGTTLTGGGEGGNIYKCRPDGSKLERVATGFWNPFHVTFDAFGRLFAVDNDPDSRPPCRLLHIVADGDYGYRFRNGRRGLHPFTAWNGELPGTLPMVAGTGEAPSGLVVYESDNLPSDYRGNILVTSWGDHRIDRFKLEPRGASLRSTAEPVVTGGENFRPVGLAQAPDGSLFATDWVDKSYPLHGKGRIWHLKRTKPAKRETPSDPPGRLAHADRSVREHEALRLASEHPNRSGPSGPDLLARALASSPDARARAVALQTLVLCDEPRSDKALAAALNDRSAEVRALAVRLLPRRLVDARSAAAGDESPVVRAEALRRIDRSAGKEVLIKALQSDDPFMTQAAREGLKRTLGTGGILELARNESAAVRLNAMLILREGDEPAARDSLDEFLSDSDPAVRFAAIQWVGERGLTEYRKRIEDALAHGASTRRLFEASIATLERLEGTKRIATDELAGDEYVAKLVGSDKTAPSVRRRSLRMLRSDHPALTLKLLTRLADTHDERLQIEAVRSLRESPHAGRTAVLMRIAGDAAEPAEVRAEAIVGLAGEAADQRALLLRLATDDNPSIRHEALRSLRGASLTESERAGLEHATVDTRATKALLEQVLGKASAPVENRTVDDWLRVLGGSSNPAEGERIFFHPRGPGCYRCHQVDGRGGRAGPDLSTTGQVLDIRRLVESIVQPSREVAPQFVNWLIVKRDGTVANGILLAESAEGEQTYADAKGHLFTLKTAEIEERKPQAASIMPDDLCQIMTVHEFRNVLAFLRFPRSDDEPSK